MITQIEVDVLLPYARRYAQQSGPMISAGDDSIGALAAAQANAELLRAGWCSCDGDNDEVYFARATGSHGWMCAKCRKLTQSG